jgi:hypothetical protein
MKTAFRDPQGRSNPALFFVITAKCAKSAKIFNSFKQRFETLGALGGKSVRERYN